MPEKKVAKKRVAKKIGGVGRLEKLRAQVAELKAENRTLKADVRQKDRQIAALLKALGGMEKKISRFVATEQKALIKQLAIAQPRKRRRARRAAPAEDA